MKRDFKVMIYKGYHDKMGVAIHDGILQWYIPADGVIGKVS